MVLLKQYLLKGKSFENEIVFKAFSFFLALPDYLQKCVDVKK